MYLSYLYAWSLIFSVVVVLTRKCEWPSRASSELVNNIEPSLLTHNPHSSALILPDSRQILNRGLVVRIGKQDSASKQHTVCSKMTTTRQHNNTTTTTKITIDLSPSPPTTDKRFLYTKYNKRSQNPHHSFKSTPLVLNTIKDQKEAVSRVPQQLEVHG